MPVSRDAVEERLIDVIIDEVGHVSYNRLCLGPLGLAQARMLCPIVAAGLGDVVPEFRTSGLTLGTSVDRPPSHEERAAGRSPTARVFRMSSRD